MKKRTGAGVLALLLKIGPKIASVVAKLAKGAKFGKIGLAAGSAVSYSFLFTWQFAAMLLFMLFVHESGHIWAMKRYGMKTKGIYFIPFLGGAAVTEDEFPSRQAEAVIAIMGPIWGLALSGLTALVYLVTQQPVFAAAAGWMAAINLFNLLPINPLDGGRIFKSIAFSIHSKLGLVMLLVGMIAAGFLAFYAGFFIFLFLLVVGGLELLLEYKRTSIHLPMTGDQILKSVAVFMVVAASLWTLMYYMQHIPGADLAMELLKG